MNSRECRVTRREIDESDLHQELSRPALTHLASCASCSEFRDQRASLRELVGDLGPVTAPPDFEMRLRARIASEGQSPARGVLFRGFAVTTPAIAFAALIVMALMFWLVQHSRNQSPTLDAVKTTPAPDAVKQPDNSSPVITPKNDGTQTVASLPVESPRPAPNKDFGARPNQSLVAKVPGIKSMDIGLKGAETIRMSDRNPGEVSLSAPLRPMVVSMENDRGMTQRFSLPPVSFGSQRLVDNRVPVSATNVRSW